MNLKFLGREPLNSLLLWTLIDTMYGGIKHGFHITRDRIPHSRFT